MVIFIHVSQIFFRETKDWCISLDCVSKVNYKLSKRELFLFFFAQKKFFCVCFTKFIAKFTSFKHMGSKGKFPNDIKKFEKK